MSSTYARLCREAQRIVIHTSEFIQGELGKVKNKQIETKSLNSLVSYVDKEAEEQLVTGLSELLPGSVFITEEDTIDNQDGEWQWIIDPLDGTTNFLYQIPIFCISVALRYQDELVLGVVYEINRKECFYGWKGGGVFLNQIQVKVRKNDDLADSLLATGFPYYDYERTDAYLQCLKYFMQNTRGIRRMGAAAVDLAYVAAGRFDGFFEYSLQPWDVAAGAFLIQEAGGVITDFKGGDNFLFGNETIAASPKVHAAMLSVIDKAF
ncbi:inositol monophosphatase family protein [Flavilitoribacter nigricans]|uniref:Inositol-1-monophosphatase n=1 Tax=Flavilitoribacter nigricans (strain ATCC 23147 / DSM 23189 / NBRC 102662 / NCIMB 1420 / SS-2) TaxID=1122177 RepID=A0A2D0N4V4_FLAN2|nr:inositol monophosphatase family protein [Flavilitoribacter nigricans]PHN03189.1 inositol monophosphatase [Flavilitoribacter nigricans DSM 23189 = NBRC 102662]